MNRNSELVYVAAWVMSLNEEENNNPGSIQWDPPAEMEQFGFLVGQWEGRGTLPRNGEFAERECFVKWNATELLDGWAIQDEIKVYSSTGRRLSKSTLLRTYSADREQWHIVELSLPGQQITEFEAQRLGDQMIMHGFRDNGTSAHHVRYVYHDIYNDSFKMRMAVSTDGNDWSGPEFRFVMKRK